MPQSWIADRTQYVDSSGIRKVFDLAAKMKNPINLSIGQPDFPVPTEIKNAAIEAIKSDQNGYSLTQGVPKLRERLQSKVDKLGHPDRKVFVTSGTSGSLVLAALAMINPGDEVICFDPYFVMYPSLVQMVGGKPIIISTYPDFKIDPVKVEAAITPRTKMIIINSPSNPTGIQPTASEIQALAEISKKHNLALLSDEIYSKFCYDEPLVSPTQWNDQTLVLDGFSKAYGVTGWRLGYMHGPSAVIEKMIMLQQYTFVCAPHPLQLAALKALDVDMTPQVDIYRTRRNHMLKELRSFGYEVAQPGGAFYIFPKVPTKYASASEFVKKAIENELLIIPGSIFSKQDTHFRISYAATLETLNRGLEVLKSLA